MPRRRLWQCETAGSDSEKICVSNGRRCVERRALWKDMDDYENFFLFSDKGLAGKSEKLVTKFEWVFFCCCEESVRLINKFQNVLNMVQSFFSKTLLCAYKGSSAGSYGIKFFKGFLAYFKFSSGEGTKSSREHFIRERFVLSTSCVTWATKDVFWD